MLFSKIPKIEFTIGYNHTKMLSNLALFSDSFILIVLTGMQMDLNIFSSLHSVKCIPGESRKL